MDNRRTAGILLLAGTIVFIAGMAAAQFLFDGYSLSQNYISDLGVGNNALIFNGSIIILGIMVIVTAALMPYRKKYTAFVALGGAGAMLVGAFPAPSPFHVVGAALAFVIGGIFALCSWKIMEKPLSYATALGVISLFSLALWASGVYLGLGPGGMERAIAYPILAFLIIFGYSLIKK
jgi:hypothetical membrane protein